MEDSNNIDNSIEEDATENNQEEGCSFNQDNTNTQNQSLYDVLGVKSDASAEEIREKYRILAREAHPDINPTHHDIEFFIKARRAYEILKDKKKRAEYDKTIGIYHSKIHGGGFIRDTSHQILKNKLDTDEEIEEIEKSKILPQYAYFKKEREQGTLVDKILNFFKKDEKKDEIQINNKQTKKKDEPSLTPKRQREYQFSIDPLESLLGTERIIVLNEGFEGQNTIKVKIPKNINDKSVLKIFHQVRGTIPIRVVFHKHPHISRNGEDVTLRVPIAESELSNQISLDLYTCQSKYHLTLPGNNLNPITLQEEGVRNNKTEKIGDFIVQPYLDNEKSSVDRINILKLLAPLHYE